MSWRPAFFVCMFWLGLTCGCQDGGGDRPKVVPVRGKVTLRGVPVEGADIKFQPKIGQTSAFGVTDAAGNYTLTTFEGGDGAAPGE